MNVVSVAFYLKPKVAALKQNLSRHGLIVPSHSKLLEVVSRAYGFRDWHHACSASAEAHLTAGVGLLAPPLDVVTRGVAARLREYQCFVSDDHPSVALAMSARPATVPFGKPSEVVCSLFLPGKRELTGLLLTGNLYHEHSGHFNRLAAKFGISVSAGWRVSGNGAMLLEASRPAFSQRATQQPAGLLFRQWRSNTLSPRGTVRALLASTNVGIGRLDKARRLDALCDRWGFRPELACRDVEGMPALTPQDMHGFWCDDDFVVGAIGPDACAKLSLVARWCRECDVTLARSVRTPSGSRYRGLGIIRHSALTRSGVDEPEFDVVADEVGRRLKSSWKTVLKRSDSAAEGLAGG